MFILNLFIAQVFVSNVYKPLFVDIILKESEFLSHQDINLKNCLVSYLKAMR
jgi:hypothetical protein